MTNNENVKGSRFAENALIGIGVVAVLYFGREILIPIALAGLISFLLAPAVIRLQRLRLGKTVSVAAVVLVFFSVIVLLCWAGFGQAYTLVGELPSYGNNIGQKLRGVSPRGLSRLTQAQHMLGDISGAILPPANTSGTTGGKKPLPVEVREPEPSPLEFLQKSVGSLAGPLATAFIVLVFVPFMLLGHEDLRDRLLRLAGSNRLFMTTQALDDAARRVSRYLLMQFVVNGSFGLCVGIGLAIIGVPHPLVWAVMVTFLRFIPYVGSWMAAAGPLLLAIGVAPGWGKFAWTFGLYVTLEITVANLVEPWVYGSSTGISAIAILIAAIFWTWLWGQVGLLLSTPLTVCLVVLGRYVPHMEFLGVLFGDEPALSPAQRFYQRMIARDSEEAGELVEQFLKEHSFIECCDNVLIPAVGLVEEGRNAGFLDTSTERYFLENTRELMEEIGSRESADQEKGKTRARMLCIPANDSADELLCVMLAQAWPGGGVEVLPVGDKRERLDETILKSRPDLICVSGAPPHAIRHVAVSCRHLRRRHPEAQIMAAVWSTSDLNSIRAKIPVSDATHVICTMQQAFEYICNLTGANVVEQQVGTKGQIEKEGSEEPAIAFEQANPTAPLQEILDKLVCKVANAVQAPTAVLSVRGEDQREWKAVCGVPADLAPALEAVKHDAENLIESKHGEGTIVAEELGSDARFRQSALLAEQGIQFCAVRPIVNARHRSMGFLTILDTRRRSLTSPEEQALREAALAVVEQMELRSVAPPMLESKPSAKPAAEREPELPLDPTGDGKELPLQESSRK